MKITSTKVTLIVRHPWKTIYRGNLIALLALALLFSLSLIVRYDTFSNAQLGNDAVVANYGLSEKYKIYNNQEIFLHNTFVLQIYGHLRN
jgi:hypothetical protein